MNKKLLLAAVGLLLAGTAYADEYVPVGVDYSYVGPNYSGYYNYGPGTVYTYVGPNYSGYYNYTTPDRISIVGVEVVKVVGVVETVNVVYPACCSVLVI